MNRRRPTVTQKEIERLIKAARAAGLTVAEVITTRDGVRIVTADGSSGGSTVSPLDEWRAGQDGAR